MTERPVDAEFVAWLSAHDSRRETTDRLRRLERRGVPKAVLDAERLTAGMFPGFAGARSADS